MDNSPIRSFAGKARRRNDLSVKCPVPLAQLHYNMNLILYDKTKTKDINSPALLKSSNLKPEIRMNRPPSSCECTSLWVALKKEFRYLIISGIDLASLFYLILISQTFAQVIG